MSHVPNVFVFKYLELHAVWLDFLYKIPLNRLNVLLSGSFLLNKISLLNFLLFILMKTYCIIVGRQFLITLCSNHEATEPVVRQGQ